MIGYFITGTDTGVGKTFVTCALARRARERGARVFAFKPIETGCVDELGDDQRRLVDAAGGWQTGMLRGAIRLQRPVSPRSAARGENVIVDVDKLARVAREGAASADLTLVEGAGGWRVPLTDHEHISDLARALRLPVIVVARATLGTINHSLLTIEAIERDGLRLAAVVLSLRPEEDPAFALENADEIARIWKGCVVLFEGRLASLDVLVTSAA